MAAVQCLSVRGSANGGPVHARRLSTLRRGIHPGAEIGLGVSDLLSDAVPPRTVTLPSPDSERFNFDTKEACDLVGIEQWL